jgi:hypothetical protein
VSAKETPGAALTALIRRGGRAIRHQAAELLVARFVAHNAEDVDFPPLPRECSGALDRRRAFGCPSRPQRGRVVSASVVNSRVDDPGDVFGCRMHNVAFLGF